MPPVLGRRTGGLFPDSCPYQLKKEIAIMNDKIAALLNQQINKEFYSAYL